VINEYYIRQPPLRPGRSGPLGAVSRQCKQLSRRRRLPANMSPPRVFLAGRARFGYVPFMDAVAPVCFLIVLNPSAMGPCRTVRTARRKERSASISTETIKGSRSWIPCFRCSSNGEFFITIIRSLQMYRRLWKRLTSALSLTFPGCLFVVPLNCFLQGLTSSVSSYMTMGLSHRPCDLMRKQG
jgi:hypothetical protein